LSYLFMSMLGDIAPVDKEHLVSLVKARYCVVCGRVGRHTGHNDRHPLVCTTLETLTSTRTVKHLSRKFGFYTVLGRNFYYGIGIMFLALQQLKSSIQ